MVEAGAAPASSRCARSRNLFPVRGAKRTSALFLAVLPLLAISTLSCEGRRADPRPSIVLIVIDTLRADAVSAYGSVEKTTPELDALAAQGWLYEHARAPAPWTLPSHASLLTGLPPSRHHVGMPGRIALAESAVTLAERLRRTGYETVAFSENMLVSDAFSLLQGFERKAAAHVAKIDRGEGMTMDVVVSIDPSREVADWIQTRDSSRPFFLFVNLFEAHDPYEVRDENAWVPTGVTRRELMRRPEHPNWLLCNALPEPDDLRILHGLYLGNVHAADSKVSAILEQLRARRATGNSYVVVTSDHGELFGEGRLLGHEFSVAEPALRVPLIVRPPGGMKPQRIGEPVSLIDLAPTILGWAGEHAPDSWTGRPLPHSNKPHRPTRERAFFSAYSDAYPSTTPAWKGVFGRRSKDALRQACGESDRVFGGMISLVRYPFKLSWYERYPAQLHDLSWDPSEKSDLASQQPDRVRRMKDEVIAFATAAGLSGPAASEEQSTPNEDAIRALQKLGYIR